MNILAIADIVGRPGRNILFKLLPQLKKERSIDFVIANAENAAAGFGVTVEIAQELLNSGVDCLTLGNHAWDKKELISFISQEPRILRPANFPPQNPGSGVYIAEKEGIKIAILSLIGRVFMDDCDCPFRAADEEISKIEKITPVILVDMHAEATSEKMAMGYFLDGRVSVVFGTHTHVSTTDLKLLPKGTAYITDIGMTGPFDSVIGIKKELIIDRFITGMPVRFEVAAGIAQLEGIIFQVDKEGKVYQMRRIREEAE